MVQDQGRDVNTDVEGCKCDWMFVTVGSVNTCMNCMESVGSEAAVWSCWPGSDLLSAWPPS